MAERSERSKKKKTTSGSRSLSPRKIVEAAKSIFKKRAPAKRKTAKKETSVVEKAPIYVGSSEGEYAAEESKYFSGPVIQKFTEQAGYELPSGYGDCRITIMVRDPHWLHAYWEVPDWKIKEVQSLMGNDNFSKSRRILRVYDVTDIIFTGVNANKFFDIDISTDARNWYINTGEPNRSYCVDIGYLSPDGRFYVIARSNIVLTPRDGMSEIIDEEWLTIDWDRMYALSGGFGVGKSSGEIRELIKRRLREEMSSGMFVTSWGSKELQEKYQKEKDFWLVANTELILYGATEPDAKLTVQGLPVKLKQDGTFSMRFALPDGRQEIPIVAVDRDGDQRRSITKMVEKRTK